MKTHFTKKEQVVILIVISIIVLVVGFKFLSKQIMTKNNKNDKDNELIIKTDNLEKEMETDNDIDRQEEQYEKDIKEDIIVHISGQVENPGIVELKSGERLMDAVELLGGLTGEADEDRINLAKKLQDEEKIYIPKIGEELEIEILDAVETSNSVDKDTEKGRDKIDINICTKEELNSLPGIGDVLSDRILEYREDNIFKTIEDIMNVSGVGDKKFEGLKDLIIIK
ncbi:MAG: SLBB domain-containing protein [Tissierella sp.]|uniref:SLBB domain-containing protein n=1 Tax=Tissierella sp. TaxID=41274 RepID=UPI003F96D872